MLLIIIWYFFHNYFWRRPRPRPHSPGLGLVALASTSKVASALRFWPRLTSLTQVSVGLSSVRAIRPKSTKITYND